MENTVFIELLRRKLYSKSNNELYYWKDYQGREVDFVVKTDTYVKQLIQVTYASSRETIEKREIDSLVSASDELKCKGLLALTWDYEGSLMVEGKKIICTPLWKWLSTLTL